MAKIFYSMAGEGRGHATRVWAVAERLRHKHELVLIASDQAYDFLQKNYSTEMPGIQLHRVPGMRFIYKNGRLALGRSIRSGLAFRWGLPKAVRSLVALMEREKPDLAIADFEAILPRAAKKCGVPLIVVNHQDFARAYDLSILPIGLRWYAWWIGQVCRAHHAGQVETVVSAFFKPPLRPGFERVVQVGPLLRPGLTQLQPTTGDYVLSYLRKFTPQQIIELFTELDVNVKVYGAGELPPRGHVTFHAIDEERFAADLAGCSAYIGAAGNQSLGELLHFGKPVLALPEPKHHEQLINSHFIRHMQVGDFRTIDAVTLEVMQAFLGNLDRYRERLAPLQGTMDGTDRVVEVIERHLPQRGEPSDPAGATAANQLAVEQL